MQGFEDVLLFGFDEAFLKTFVATFLTKLLGQRSGFLTAFFTELFGECHGVCREFGVCDFLEFPAEGGLVNVPVEDVAHEHFEGSGGDFDHERLVPDGVAEEFAEFFGLEGAEGEDAHRGAEDFVEGHFEQLDESELEVGRVFSKGVDEAFRGLYEIEKARGGFPGFVVLGEDEREDRRESVDAGMVSEVAIPDVAHRGEKAQAHETVLTVLVFEEDVEERGSAVDLDRVKQVAGGGREFGVDEAAADEFERGPIRASRNGFGQVGFQKSTSGVEVREGRLDEFVVGLVQGGVGHRVGYFRARRASMKDFTQRARKTRDTEPRAS